METITIYKSNRLARNYRKGYFTWYSETEKKGFTAIEVTKDNFTRFGHEQFIKAEYRRSRTGKKGFECDFYKNFKNAI